MQKSTTENLALKLSEIKREARTNCLSGTRSISHSFFVQGTVPKNRSQFPQRGNCCLSLNLAPFNFVKRPCPLGFRGIFLE